MMTHPYAFAGLPEKEQRFTRHGIKVGEPEEIISAVSEVLDIPFDQITGRFNKREPVEARHIAIGMIAMANPKLSLKAIGRIFSGRDHSTIIYSKNNFENLYKTDKQFREKVNAVKKITHLR